jgi:hypothetical protein
VVVGVVVGQRHQDHRRQVRAHSAGLDDRHLGPDHARRAQSGQAALHGARRQAHLVPQLVQRARGVDLPIDLGIPGVVDRSRLLGIADGPSMMWTRPSQLISA